LLADEQAILSDLIGRHLHLMLQNNAVEEANKCAPSIARLIKILDKRDPSTRREVWSIMRSLSEESTIMLGRDEIPGKHRIGFHHDSHSTCFPSDLAMLMHNEKKD